MHALSDFAEGIEFVFLAQAVGFVNEDFEVDVWVVLCQEYGRPKELINAGQIFILAVDDPYRGTDVGEDGRVVKVR